MSTPGLWRRYAMTVVALALLGSLAGVDRWAVSREAVASEALRLARVDLQRAESLRATLHRSSERLPAIDAGLETVSLAILETTGLAGALPGVSELQYRLSTDDDVVRTLRLTFRVRVQNEDVLLQLLDTLRTAATVRPSRVAGCRVLRPAAPDIAGPSPGLALDCAIDWSWWPGA